MDSSNIVGIFGLSSAVCAHLLTITYFGIKDEWYRNKWFWAGFFGSLPALVAIIGHIFLSRNKDSE